MKAHQKLQGGCVEHVLQGGGAEVEVVPEQAKVAKRS